MKPQIMAVINCTPDSFYDGCEATSTEFARKALSLASQGADILDIGGESSRPGAMEVEVNEEIDRVIPVIEEIKKENDSLRISIDTRKAPVAEAALKSGAEILNDITGGDDPKMFELAAKHDADFILMHMQGAPENMQKAPTYSNVVEEVCQFFTKRTEIAIKYGLANHKIWLDPGIGFGKALDHNIELMKNLNRFKGLGHEVCLGISRKSFIAKISPKTGKNVADRLPGSLAPLASAWQQGVNMYRVHDVQATRQFFDVLLALQ